MRDRLPLATTPSGIDAGVSAVRKGLKKDRLQLRDRGKTPAELRSLGLPKRALMTVWKEKMQGRFGAAEKL